MNDLSPEFYLSLGQKLKEVRQKAGLQQPAVAREMGIKPSTGQVFISRLEHGKDANVTLGAVVRYLQACKTPVGKFMLELAQAGVFGEAEQGLTIVDDKARAEEARRAKARARHEQSAAKAAEDADIIARLWREVLPAIQPLLPKDPTVFLSQYLEGVRTFYRVWKRAIRGAMNRTRPRLFPQAPHPRGFAPEDGKPGAIRASFPVTPLGEERDVQMAFDRVEQAGLEARLVPAAVRKMREIVFDRLMELMPQGGKS